MKFPRTLRTLLCLGVIVCTSELFGSNLVANWPARSPAAMSGSEFMLAIEGLDAGTREQAILNEILRGNVPDFLRQLRPVSYQLTTSSGELIKLTTFVSPDYLAIGSDDDFVRVPVNLISAQKIAQAFAASLPTRKMVKTLYRQADIQVRPAPKRPGKAMTSLRYYLEHNDTIQGMVTPLQMNSDDLVAGHKKDVVLTRKLAKKPGAIAIYGWHRSASNPIQPLSTVHAASYADYSHGIRLVHNWALLDQDGIVSRIDLETILTSRQHHKLLSDEGRFEKSLFQAEQTRASSSI